MGSPYIDNFEQASNINPLPAESPRDRVIAWMKAPVSEVAASAEPRSSLGERIVTALETMDTVATHKRLNFFGDLLEQMTPTEDTSAPDPEAPKL